MKPLLRDALLLLGLQLGISALMAGVLALLRTDAGSGSWVGAVGGMVGAQTFVMMREKRNPGGLDAKTLQRLALAATLGQIVAAILILVAIRTLTPPAEDGLLSLPASWLVGTLAVGAAFAYVATRIGFRMGLKNSRRPPKAKKP
jgi:uncharacterized membrane protein YbhN (UPF0104 family)